MNIFTHFAATLNAAFSDLGAKRTGKNLFFILFFIIFGIISAICIYALFLSFVQLESPGANVEYAESHFYLILALANKSNMIGILIVIFLMRYFYSRKPEFSKSYSISDLFKSLQLSEWAFFVIGIAVAFGLVYFVSKEMYPSYSIPRNSIDKLLSELGREFDPKMKTGFSKWLETFTYWLILYSPLVILSVYLVWLKSGGLTLKAFTKNRRHFIVFVLLFLMLNGGYYTIALIFNQIFMGFIALPFEELYIIIIFSIIGHVFLNALFYLVMSKVAYYSFFVDEDGVVLNPDASKSEGKLLDDLK